MNATIDANAVIQALRNQRNAALDECAMLAAQLAELEKRNKELMEMMAKDKSAANDQPAETGSAL